MAKEQCDTNQCITTVVAGRIDYSTVSFTTDNSIGCLHLCYYVYFAYGRSIIFHTILTSHITQSTGRTQVRNSVTRSMFQYIIGNSNQCIFLTIHYTVLANHSQTVNVRVYYKSYISFSTFHQVHDVTQVLFKWFRVVLEVSGRLAVEFFYMFHAQTLKQFGKNNTAYRIHTVDSYTETGFLNGFYIH